MRSVLPALILAVGCHTSTTPQGDDDVTGTPALHFADTEHDFGLVEANKTATVDLELRNDGTAPAPIDGFDIGAGFRYAGTTCLGELAAGASCTVSVTFAPTALGPIAGNARVVSGNDSASMQLRGIGAFRVDVVRSGSGAGTVTAPPIDCGSTCSGLFVKDVNLVAAPSANTSVTWSVASCAHGLACTIPAHGGSTSVTVTFSPGTSTQLELHLAGDAPGEIRVWLDGAIAASCNADCIVPVTEGQGVNVLTASPAASALSGACTSRSGCSFTAGGGKQPVTATFTRDTTAHEEWISLVDQSLSSAAFDSAGNLIATGGGTFKLSPTGAVIWHNATGAVSVAIGPGDTIYLHAGTELVKLAPDGTPIWSAPIPADTRGCTDIEGFAHCLGVAPDGAAVIHGSKEVTRWDSDGHPTWSRPLSGDGAYTLAVDLLGIAHVAQLSPINGEELDDVRFATDGSSLATIAGVTSQYHGMFTIDPATGALVASASGHSHVDGVGSVDLSDPDYVPNGIARSANGDTAWVYWLDDGDPFNLDWQLHRFDPARTKVWTHSGGIASDMITFTSTGTQAFDLAISSTGRIVVVGNFVGFNAGGGFIESFAP